MKKLMSMLLCLLMLSGMFTAFAVTETGDIVILYTNDTHTSIYGENITMSFDSVAALKKELVAAGNNVILADAGDHSQGTAYGAMDNGRSVIEIMNTAGYDVAAIGNHEFDYNMSGFKDILSWADFSYVSCNFTDLTTGKTVADSYKMFTFGDIDVAVMGITTPETMTSTAPVYFQDGNGKFLYDVLGGKDGAQLYAAVQKTADEARADGAEYVVALAHLGIDETSSPWTSRDVIANTTGIDAFIDGHSHNEIESETVKNKAGKEIILSQTGSYFNAIGKLTITKDGKISAQLVKDYKNSDTETKAKLDAWVSAVDTALGEKIAESLTDLVTCDTSGRRLVRIMSTNMADFNVDAYYYLLNEIEQLSCDVAIYNGGGVRADALKGEWTYKTMKAVNPFGNIICMVQVTGQQILDALEWASRFTTGKADAPEEGSFLHTAGLYFEVDTTKKANIEEKDGVWAGTAAGEYRVGNIKVYNKESKKYEPIDLNKTYTLAGANYTLRNGGGGFEMLKDAKLVKDYIMEDYMALVAYAKAFRDSDNDGVAEISTENSPLAAYSGYLINYEDIYGSGRINIHEGTPKADPTLEVPSASPDGEKTEGNTDGKGETPADKPVAPATPSDTETKPSSGSDIDGKEKKTDNYLVFFLILVAVGGVIAVVMAVRAKKD